MNAMATVRTMYEAFSRGDVPTILSHLAEDVEWEYNTFPNPLPWLQPLQGRAEVPKFFAALAQSIEITQFEPRAFFQDGPLVVDLIDVRFVVRATGREVVEPESVHLWHFNERGQVQRFRHRVDTWQAAMALQGGNR